jgi:hypothetical protein
VEFGKSGSFFFSVGGPCSYSTNLLALTMKHGFEKLSTYDV